MKKYPVTILSLCILTVLIFHTSPAINLYAADESFYNIKTFGAVGDAKTLDTQAIQLAIDQASRHGGGTVFIPAGSYLTKTIILKDNITLRIDNGATILASTDMHEFLPDLGSFKDSGGRRFGASVLFASDAKNITIEGDGVIDGQGYKEFYPVDQDIARPSIIRFIRCSNVKVKDITLLNSAAWVSHYVECEDLLIRGITIRSYSNNNND
jgi:polygalacturonase